MILVTHKQISEVIKMGKRKTKKILLVDDEEQIIDALELLLKPYGFDLNHAYGIEESKQMINATHYDLLICDMSLNENTGNEGVEIVKESQTVSPKTKIIIYSGHGSKESLTSIINQGGKIDRFIEKSASNQVIISSIEELIGLPNTPSKEDIANSLIQTETKINEHASLEFPDNLSKSYHEQKIVDEKGHTIFKKNSLISVDTKVMKREGINHANFYFLTVTGKNKDDDPTEQQVTIKKFKTELDCPGETIHAHSPYQREHPHLYEARIEYSIFRSYLEINKKPKVPQLFDVLQNETSIVRETIKGETLEKILKDIVTEGDFTKFFRYMRATVQAVAEFHHIGSRTLQKKPDKEKMDSHYHDIKLPLEIADQNILYDSNSNLILFQPTRDDNESYHFFKFLNNLEALCEFAGHSFEEIKKGLREDFKPIEQILVSEEKEKNFIHGDCYPKNLLVKEGHNPNDEESIKEAIYFIDDHNARVGSPKLDLHGTINFPFPNPNSKNAKTLIDHYYMIDFNETFKLIDQYMRRIASSEGNKTIVEKFGKSESLALNDFMFKYKAASLSGVFRAANARKYDPSSIVFIEQAKQDLTYSEKFSPLKQKLNHLLEQASKKLNKL